MPAYNVPTVTGCGSISILSKLQISKKIVGRDNEIERLQEMYRKIRDETPHLPQFQARKSVILQPVRSRSVFVKGISGTGKSALVQAAFNEMVETDDHGYYIEGKFNLMNHHLPFSAVADALESLCSKAIRDDDYDSKSIKGTSLRQKIKEIFRNDEAVLAGLLPNLLVGDHSPAPLAATSRQTSVRQSNKNTFFRLKELVVSLVKLLVGDRVLVMFIDDLQWACVDSLELIDELVEKLSPTKFLFVGGFRSDEVSEDDYLTQQLLRQPIDAPVVILIQGLQVDAVASFLADTLKKEKEVCTPLAELVYEKTNGNMFFVKQYIDALYHNGHIFNNLEDFGWEWEDLVMIQDACTVEEGDVEAVVSKKIMRMPSKTVVALKQASCIGGRFDLNMIDFMLHRWYQSEACATHTMSTGVDQQTIEEVMWPAVEEGLLEEMCVDSMAFSATVYYKFAHDKVQSAAYSLIATELTRYHLLLGNCLEELYNSPEGQPWMLIFAADHVYQGKDMLGSQDTRDQAAELHYLAARELQTNSAFLTAAEYLRNALHLLGDEPWTRKYNLTLKVSNLSAEMENCSGVQVECEKRVSDIMDNANCLDDQETAYYVKMSNLSSMQRDGEALKTGLALLRRKKMGRIPKHIGQAILIFEVLSTIRLVQKLSTEELLAIANAVDERVAGYLKATIEAIVCAWFANQANEFVFLTMRAVKISLKYGYSPSTPTVFAIFGGFYINLGKFRECERLGHIGMDLLMRFGDPERHVLTKYLYTVYDHLFTPLQDYSERYCEIHSTALRHCNVGVACMASGTRAIIAYLNGAVRLDKLVSICAQYRDEMIAYNKLKFLPITRMARQIALNMMGKNRTPSILQGEEIKDLQAYRREIKHDPYSERCCVYYSMQLAYLFGDIDQAITFAHINLKEWKVDISTSAGVWMPFYRGLIWCSAYKRDGFRVYKRLAKRELKILQDWVKAGLSCRRALAMFLKTEIIALIEKQPLSKVKTSFEVLMEELESVGMNNITALGAERAAMYFQELDRSLSLKYLDQSVAAYCGWRAMGKVRHLKKTFSSFSTFGMSTESSYGDFSFKGDFSSKTL